MSNNVEPSKSSNKLFIWIGLIAVIAIIGGAVWVGVGGMLSDNSPAASASSATTTELEPLPKAGHPAPEFTLKNLNGEEVSLSDFRGQPVVLNFWATWCGPCRVEMPHFQEAYQEHQDDGLVILGVNLTERDNPRDIPGFQDEFGLTFPIILDENGNVAETYNVFGQPASVFIDENGVVTELFYGPVNKAFIDEKVGEILSS